MCSAGCLNWIREARCFQGQSFHCSGLLGDWEWRGIDKACFRHEAYTAIGCLNLSREVLRFPEKFPLLRGAAGRTGNS